MSLSEETYARAIRLGRLVPKTDERAPSNVIAAAIPVSPANVVFQEYPAAASILDTTAEFYGISTIDIKSSRRSDRITRPRHISAYLMKSLTLMSFPMIGRALGSKDHSTAHYGAGKISEEMKTNPRLADEITLLKIKIAESMAAENERRKLAAES